MKILFVDVNCQGSSTGKIVYDLYTGCREQGFEAAICYGRGKVVREHNVFKFGLDIETYFHALMTRITGLTGCFSWFSTRRLIKFIDKYKPDIVHLHDLHAYFLNIIPLLEYLKRNNISTVWTFHCEFMYTGKCGIAHECEKWKYQCEKCPNIKTYPSSLFFDFTDIMFRAKRRIFEKFDNLIIVTPSNWLANRVKQSFLRNNRIVIIRNGIDTKNLFHPRKFGYIMSKHNLASEKIVLAVAPDIMSKQKGGNYVLELANAMKNEKTVFILIGASHIKQKCGDNVIVLGRTENQEELAEYYSMADIFVICSQQENFPTTCIEALSCGTPILGFNAGGTCETAPAGYGVFVSFGDVEKLKENLQAIFSGAIRLKSKEECAQYGKDNFDKSVMVNKYICIYNDLLA